jgi:murein DD-endopeptidase MepM/ murein hydrolase activator NlpD
MKHILNAPVWNKFRSNKPKGFYNWLKGHSGIDYGYVFEDLPSPVSGIVEKIATGLEMGLCIYLKDMELGNIHVFAHLEEVKVGAGDKVTRNQVIAKTGNSGAKSTEAHLHAEVITFRKPPAKKADWTAYDYLFNPIMTRSLNGYQGWNIDPNSYYKALYTKYKLSLDGEPLTNQQ